MKRQTRQRASSWKDFSDGKIVLVRLWFDLVEKRKLGREKRRVGIMSLKRQEGTRCTHQDGSPRIRAEPWVTQQMGVRSIWHLGAYGHCLPVAFIFLGNQDTKPLTESEDGGGGCGGSKRAAEV